MMMTRILIASYFSRPHGLFRCNYYRISRKAGILTDHGECAIFQDVHDFPRSLFPLLPSLKLGRILSGRTIQRVGIPYPHSTARYDSARRISYPEICAKNPHASHPGRPSAVFTLSGQKGQGQEAFISLQRTSRDVRIAYLRNSIACVRSNPSE